MAYARIDMNNRILEWSDDHLDGFDTEFDNGDYIYENERNGVQDFIIEQGKAIFSPTDESVAEFEEARKWDDLPNSVENIQDGLLEVADMAADDAAVTDEILDALTELGDMIADISERLETLQHNDSEGV